MSKRDKQRAKQPPPDNLEAKPPEFLSNLKWFLTHGKQHWKLLLLVVLLVVLVFNWQAVWKLLPFHNEQKKTVSPEGGGAINPMVLFKSDPPGVTVSYVRIFYAYDDPFLESEKAKANTVTLKEKTPVQVPIYQGQYQVMFTLDGRKKSQTVTITGPTDRCI